MEDADSLLALLRRTTDVDGWLEPMLADPDSAATVNALIAEYARLGRAVDYDSRLPLISEAPGGTNGTCQTTLSRPSSGTAGTIPKGYAFVDPRGIRLVSATDVVVGSGVLQVVVPLQTLRQIELVNTEDDPGLAIDTVNAVALDGLGTTALIAPPGDPLIVATTFQAVVSTTQILGGTSDYLSVHGSERSQPRQPGESTEAYRGRVRNIPDAVSPLAVAEAVTGAAARAGGGAVVTEPFNDGADPAIKVPAGLSNFDVQTFDLDYYDDPGDPEHERVSLRETAAYFRVDLIGVMVDPGGAVKYHDGSYHDDPVLGFRDVDLPPEVAAAGASVWQEANNKRAAGVLFDVLVPVTQKVTGVGLAPGPEQVVVTLAPPGGSAWLFSEMIASHDVETASFSTHRVRFTFADGSTYMTPIFGDTWSEHLTWEQLASRVPFMQPITLVEMLAREADDFTPTNAVLSIWVIELVDFP